MAETLESDNCVVLSRSGSLEPDMCDRGPAVKEKYLEDVVVVNAVDVGGEGGARAEIDTSAPFESVKEAVSRFGGHGFWKPNNQQRDKDDVKHKNVFSTSEFRYTKLELETLVEEKINRLTNHIEELDAIILSRNNELNELKVSLEHSSQKIHLYNNQVQTLTETLQKAQLESQFVQELMKAFEGLEQKVAQSVKENCRRLEDSAFQSVSLSKKAKMLRMQEFWYKEKLERILSNQQKAEAEVDLLGDELERLQGLLGKIYIALDHYSPVLQHYPGIMAILSLVKRELNDGR